MRRTPGKPGLLTKNKISRFCSYIVVPCNTSVMSKFYNSNLNSFLAIEIFVTSCSNIWTKNDDVDVWQRNVPSVFYTKCRYRLYITYFYKLKLINDTYNYIILLSRDLFSFQLLSWRHDTTLLEAVSLRFWAKMH